MSISSSEGCALKKGRESSREKRKRRPAAAMLRLSIILLQKCFRARLVVGHAKPFPRVGF